MAKRRQQPKKADETLVDIVEVRDQAQDFMTKYQNYIFGALVVVVVAVGVVLFLRYRSEQRNQEAIEQMFQAQNQFEQDSFALALTDPGGGYDGFLAIMDNYGGTKAANLAHYYTGIAYLHLGKYEAAIDYLKDFKPRGEVLPIMKFGALGDAYAELNDLDQAMDYYQKAVKAGELEPLVAYYLKKIGLLHEHNGNMEEARKAYERIKKEYPTSPEGRDIEKYLARVAAG
jgi:tetratricopeptide (TPR) repeat protein